MLSLMKKIKFYVTDRCNERCVYCPIHGENSRIKARKALSPSQISAITKVAVDLGYDYVKLSGEYGEALTRGDIIEIAALINKIGVSELSIATNGVGLLDKLPSLLSSGVNKFCISLDTLDKERYREITGLDKLDEVKAAITEAGRFLGRRVKVNMVVMKSKNYDEVDALVSWAKHVGVTIQLIELYPVNGREQWYVSEHVPLRSYANSLRSQSIYSSRYKPRQMESFLLPDSSRIEITSEYDDNELFGNTRLLVHPDGGVANYDVRRTGIMLTGDEQSERIREALVAASSISIGDIGTPGVESWGFERPTVS